MQIFSCFHLSCYCLNLVYVVLKVIRTKCSTSNSSQFAWPCQQILSLRSKADSSITIKLSQEKFRLRINMADDAQAQADRERIFKRFDLNGDGRISATELGDCLKTLGSVSADEVKYMMDEIDTDGDGYISYEEFTVFALANRGLIKDVAKIF